MNRYIKKLALKVPCIKRVYDDILNTHSQISTQVAELDQLRYQNNINAAEIEQLRAQVSYRKTKYRSCFWLEIFFIMIACDANTSDVYAYLCCQPGFPLKISFAECGTAKKFYEKIFKVRADIISESKKFSILNEKYMDIERSYSDKCVKCPEFIHDRFYEGDNRIHNVSLGDYPAPCQCKCFYCGIPNKAVSDKSKIIKDYTKVMDILQYAKNNGFLAEDISWSISSGEITIHPFKDQILEFIKGDEAHFFTNCFIFSEKIAINLASNPRSFIYLSIDCGTSDTWFKIKGVDNFDTIINNLTKYRQYSNRSFPQIRFKYILLPGINDTLNEFQSLISIMDTLQINHLDLACDHRNLNCSHDQRMILLRSAGYMTAILIKYKKKIEFTVNSYSPDEGKKIIAIADELLNSGEV